MLKCKIIEVGLTELPRGTTLGGYLEGLINDFLRQKTAAEIVRMEMNTAVIPPEEGGGQYRETPPSVVVLVAIYYRE